MSGVRQEGFGECADRGHLTPRFNTPTAKANIPRCILPSVIFVAKLLEGPGRRRFHNTSHEDRSASSTDGVVLRRPGRAPWCVDSPGPEARSRCARASNSALPLRRRESEARSARVDRPRRFIRERIYARVPALRKAQPPHADLRAAGLVDCHRHGLDDRQSIGRQRARIVGTRPAVVIGGDRPGLARNPGRLGARPGTEVPGLPVMPPCH